MIKITRTMLLVCVFALAAGTVRAQKRSSVITRAISLSLVVTAPPSPSPPSALNG